MVWTPGATTLPPRLGGTVGYWMHRVLASIRRSDCKWLALHGRTTCQHGSAVWAGSRRASERHQALERLPNYEAIATAWEEHLDKKQKTYWYITITKEDRDRFGRVTRGTPSMN